MLPQRLYTWILPYFGKKDASYIPMRFFIVFLCVIAAAYALGGKAFELQVSRSDELIKEANKRSLREEIDYFTRGQILDRNGQMLSVSVPMYSITIDPKEYFDSLLKRDKNRWRKLAMDMGVSASKLQSAVNSFVENKNKEKRSYDPRALFNIDSEDYWDLLAQATNLNPVDLSAKVRHNPDSAFLALEKTAINFEGEKLQDLAKHLGQKYKKLLEKLYRAAKQRFLYIERHESEAIANYAKKLKINGLVIRREFRRFYPMGEEIAQLVGFTDIDDKKGTEGLEKSFDSLLIGKDGRQKYRKDARGNVIEQISHEKKYDPQDIVLSIDQELQSMVYREIKKSVIENKAESGTAVLIDIYTGEVLAMANAPSFNPNNRRSEFKAELARNRAITDTFEPGSTVKPLVVLTALQNGVTYRDEVINTRPFVVNGHTIKDVAPRESLTLTGILQKSSNIGVSRLALRMPSTALVDTYSKVGFGKDTGLGLGEQRGSNGDRKRWSDIERASMAYGYGLNVTPLQLARAYATLGSFGIYRPLSITKVDPPVIGERVLPEKITRDVVHMMESVAQKGEGGARAAVDGYRVAIKTGTAKKLKKEKYVEKYIAYTAGIAPASDPRFALVVLIDEPKAGAYYGGAVSAPLFSSIMGHTLKAKNIKPDNLTAH
ncbi:cell division protein FtsI [Pasteurellaceae bacterium Macca]|nr:cell division protein FtsI [Pasteurellaceae bacterium Macca]